MKNLLTLGSMASALFLGWHHHDVTDTKESADLKSAELIRQIEATRQELQIANARIAQLTGHSANWIQERNKNWQSSLNRGAYDNRQAVTGGGSTFYATGDTGITANSYSYSYSQNSIRNTIIVNPSSTNRLQRPESSAFNRTEHHDAPTFGTRTSSLNRDSDSRGKNGYVAPQPPLVTKTQPSNSLPAKPSSAPVRNSMLPPSRISPSSGGN